MLTTFRAVKDGEVYYCDFEVSSFYFHRILAVHTPSGWQLRYPTRRRNGKRSAIIYPLSPTLRELIDSEINSKLEALG